MKFKNYILPNLVLFLFFVVSTSSLFADTQTIFNENISSVDMKINDHDYTVDVSFETNPKSYYLYGKGGKEYIEEKIIENIHVLEIANLDVSDITSYRLEMKNFFMVQKTRNYHTD